MDNRIIAPHPLTGKFETVDDLLQALSIVHACEFHADHSHVGGHGTILIARPEAHTAEIEMLIHANGRGICLGQWGRQRFGHIDVGATADLWHHVARCQDCGAIVSREQCYPSYGFLCWDCLKMYIEEELG